jgi:hypothetical protein
MAENEVLLYLDSGCYLNLKSAKPRERLLDYAELTKSEGILAMQLKSGDFEIDDLSELAWSSQALHSRIPLSEVNQVRNQIQAGIIFISKRKSSCQFIEEWYRLMREEHFQYLIGNGIGKSDRFIEHRYDQSIFSMLYKASGLRTIEDETYFHPNWRELGRDFPIWAMRNRDGVNPFEFRLDDFAFKLSRRIRKLLGLSCE